VRLPNFFVWKVLECFPQGWLRIIACLLYLYKKELTELQVIETQTDRGNMVYYCTNVGVPLHHAQVY
jgi:hypothetical protein